MSTFNAAAAAVADVRSLVTSGLPSHVPAIENAQAALAAVGLYGGKIDGISGPVTRIAYACARAAFMPHQMWCYEDRVPRSRDSAETWARKIRDMGLDGVCIMVSSSEDNLRGEWRLREPRVHYVVAAEAAHRAGLGVSFMPWVRPLRAYTDAMVRDVIALCEDADVDRVDLDHEFGRSWSADMTVDEMAGAIVSAFAQEAIDVLVSSYPARAVAGDKNDDIDAYRPHMLEAVDDAWVTVFGWSPQEYSVAPGYKGRDGAIYAPRNMQRAGYERWNVAEDRKRGLVYWPGLAAYAQAGRPGYTAGTHFGDAWAQQIEHEADGSIIWTRRWLDREPDVAMMVASIAHRRRRFRDLAGAA